MDFQIGQPGVSAFLHSLLRDLKAVMKMDDFHNFPIEKEMKEMKKLLLGFECVLLDGERKRQHLHKGADRWMDQLKDSFYDVDDLLDEIKMEKQQLQQETAGQSTNNQVRYDPVKSFNTTKDIKKRLDEVVGMLGEHSKEAADSLKLKRDAIKHDDIWLKFQGNIRQKPGCYANEPEVYGREEDKNKIIEMLLTEDGGESKRKSKYEVLCVVGMRGLGKTTLAQLVFHDKRVKSFFTVRSWACVSDVFNVTKVIQNLIENASENAGKIDGQANMPSELPTLQARLARIINGQKFLLVLDDIWTANVFEQLKDPLNSGAKGSKILVTTRLREVAKDLGNKEPYQLKRLKDAQCLKIFEANAFAEGDGFDNDKDLMKMGEEIVEKCQGVPLVAKIIGSLLIGGDERKWKAVKDNDLWNSAYESEDLHPGLRLSYFYLPPSLKRCFEYFALFPSDFKFDKDELVRMWMAESLIEMKEGREPEEIGDEYYNDLMERSLIQEDNKIHDMVHHLASIVSGSSFFRVSNGSISRTSSLQSVRHALIHDKPELLNDANKLRTLIHKRYPCPEPFSCKRLRVVEVCTSTLYVSFLQSSLGGDLKHLRYIKLSGNPENCTLPDSLCTLTNLQILDLSCHYLKILPRDIGNLWNIRFLGLKRTQITGLPDSICLLTNLRKLDLSNCRDLKILPRVVGNLSNLRFLGLESTAIADLPDSVCSLSNLQVLDLCYCRSLTTLPQDIGNLNSLRKLMVIGTLVLSFPDSIVNATNICVLQMDFDILPPHMGKLTKLETMAKYYVGKEEGRGIEELGSMNRLFGYLTIENMENIESAEKASKANLRSKKHIERLAFVWEEFDAALTGRHGEMEVRVLEALEPNASIKSLSIENYVGHQFPSWMSTAPLQNLTTLMLTNLPSTTEMIGIEFKSLKFLAFCNCPVLREVSLTTPKLKALKVLKCKELKGGSLVLLPRFWDALENLICDYWHLDEFVLQLKSANASPRTKLKHLKIWVGGDNGITSLPVGWPNIFASLETLVLYDLPATNFKFVSEEDERCCLAPSELLVHISRLYIQNSLGLVSLESLKLPPRLKELYVWDCPNLRNLPYEVRNLTLTSLERINLERCPNLEIRDDDPLKRSIGRVECPLVYIW